MRVCAWCGALLDVSALPFESARTVTTHGLCDACFLELEAEGVLGRPAGLAKPGAGPGCDGSRRRGRDAGPRD